MVDWSKQKDTNLHVVAPHDKDFVMVIQETSVIRIACGKPLDEFIENLKSFSNYFKNKNID